MVEMGKECGFPSNSDMSRLLTLRKTEFPRKTDLQPIKYGLLYARVEEEQRTHSDEIFEFQTWKIFMRRPVHSRNMFKLINH